ncbi:predicted protein [Aspergillus terreus NIH2624]|uniref:Uncharacterized protein n=1 Tax=Aspergillus terreus (strain NIH 2624 / FGSC A1156) TaxID=341663 RepID=Q0CRU3_ASPTN|nr:uncharacterized protein ATEG_03591 [Aspergillus terreus NIH2624]EAU35393.1 predicted protein [Aspergillus terreus NIH2624]
MVRAVQFSEEWATSITPGIASQSQTIAEKCYHTKVTTPIYSWKAECLPYNFSNSTCLQRLHIIAHKATALLSIHKSNVYVPSKHCLWRHLCILCVVVLVHTYQIGRCGVKTEKEQR